MLSLIQKPITSDFPLQERDCEQHIYKKKEEKRTGWQTEEGEKKSTKTILRGRSFHTEKPLRFMSSQMTKFHDEMSPKKTRLCLSSDEFIQNKFIPDWTRRICCVSIKNAYVIRPSRSLGRAAVLHTLHTTLENTFQRVPGWFHCLHTLLSSSSSSSSSWFCICRIGKKIACYIMYDGRRR